MTHLFRIGCRILPLVLFATVFVARPAAAGVSCPGDCNGDQIVKVDELVRGVNIALGQQAVDSCPAFDRNGDGQVTIAELLAAVSAAIGSCPEAPTATPEATVTGTLGATATVTTTGTATRTPSPPITSSPTATA
ncbi:MAG TPA: hypothetical protein VL049_23840, partial [Candidatus Dormibacteraeota bacterium]|nr:hypothetical protein [Candidatus Dormibacteraeota bacterium]